MSQTTPNETLECDSSESTEARPTRDGKYLTFMLGQEEYGLEILNVREIIGYVNVTSVPQTPYYIKGVINLRGQVIPVVDLRSKFDMSTREPTDETCIIVVEVQTAQKNICTGLVVDKVSEVLDISDNQIEEPPVFASTVNTNYILGIGKVHNTVKILLDINEILDSDIKQGMYDVTE